MKPLIMAMKFLERLGHKPPIQDDDVPGVGVFLPEGGATLEVLYYVSKRKPTSAQLQETWKKRRGGRNTPVLVVAKHNDSYMLCGPIGPKPPVYSNFDYDWVEQLCHQVLLLTTDRNAISVLDRALGSHEDMLPGISNRGMFALHSLKKLKTERSDWDKATQQANTIKDATDEFTLAKLGFEVKEEDQVFSFLYDLDKNKTALAITLRDNEYPDDEAERFNNQSPVAQGLVKATQENLPWILIRQTGRLRLYATKKIGVGKRPPSECYVQCNIDLLQEENAALLWLLFSADALRVNGTAWQILQESERFSGGLATSLRERIYDIAMPELAMGIVAAQQLNAESRGGGRLSTPSHDDLKFSYQLALTVLFRLLFIAIAEDRDLLPYRENSSYKKFSLKGLAIELAEDPEGTKDSAATHHWRRTADLWEAFSEGRAEWGVPAYNGSLFSVDPGISKEGAALSSLRLPNKCYAKALRAILLTDTDETVKGPVDFRALSGSVLGTIYEGLLESELSVADQDLVLLADGNYRPGDKKGKINTERGDIPKGDVYLHGQSGARKSTGSYYTPDFVVDHLLDHALEPELKNHLNRLSELAEDNEDAAAEKFFDFRVADISMGSGHFLVRAIDRIERGLSGWLFDNPNSGVSKKLASLRRAAFDAQNSEILKEVDDSQLLRRAIARDCIYGIDINPLAVELARVSVWIHTFVPGLPFPLLDDRLLRGNALVGIGTLEEMKQKIREARREGSLFDDLEDLERLLSKVLALVQQYSRLDDKSVGEIELGRSLSQKRKNVGIQFKILCDLLVAKPIATENQLKNFCIDKWEQFDRYWLSYEEQTAQYSASASLASVVKFLKAQEKKGTLGDDLARLIRALDDAHKVLEPHEPLHFPLIFPEVFASGKHGFDVVLGNPPWEKVKVDADKFWCRFKPGLCGESVQQQQKTIAELRSTRPDLVEQLSRERQKNNEHSSILAKGPFPGIGSGDVDLYKAFSWRMTTALSALGSRVGMVLPHSGFVGAGARLFRQELFSNFSDINITTLRNSKQWVFVNVHGQYEISLLAASKGNATATLSGPITSNDELKETPASHTVQVRNNILLGYNKVPLLVPANKKSMAILEQMHQYRRLDAIVEDSWKARPCGEFHATNDKHFFNHEAKGWRVYAGRNYDLWSPIVDTKTLQYADPENALTDLQDKRIRANKRRSVAEFTDEWIKDEKTLPCRHARIAYRSSSSSTNRRTLICALIPPKIFLTNQSSYFLFSKGDAKDECCLLGVLSSLCADWYVRRFVTSHVDYEMIRSLPIPRCHEEHEKHLRDRIIALAGQLACPDERFKEWASSVGVEVKQLGHDEKEQLICELEAAVAHFYGLSRAQLEHIFDTFHPQGEHLARRAPTLEYFDQMQSEISAIA